MESKKKKAENNLTKGSVIRVLFTFSVPFIIANIIQALYGAVDLLVIGRYCGPESVAAVSTGTQVTQIITSLITGLTLGSTILVGKYTGMEEEEEVKKTIGTTLTIFAIAAVILTVLMLLFTDRILILLKTPEESFELAGTYVRICSLGILFICGYNAISAILRGYGDSRRPMLFIALSCVLNIAGDFILVKGAGLGVAGVALATIGSQAVSMVTAIIYLNRKKFIFTFRLKNFRIDRKSQRACLGWHPHIPSGMYGSFFLSVSYQRDKPAGNLCGLRSGGGEQIRCICHAACNFGGQRTGGCYRPELWGRKAGEGEEKPGGRPAFCGGGFLPFLAVGPAFPSDDDRVIFLRSCYYRSRHPFFQDMQL